MTLKSSIYIEKTGMRNPSMKFQNPILNFERTDRRT